MRTAALPLALLLAGCASYSGAGLAPGRSTQAEVAAAMGEPALRFEDAGGGATWAYPRGPMGYHTYMARFTSSGILAGIESVLDPDHFARVTPGLPLEDVQRLIGPPRRTERFARRDETVWDYRFMDAWGYPSQFSVMFGADGKVRQTLTWRERIDERD